MKSRRIFHYIWRINAVIILIAGLPATVLLAASAVFVILQATKTRELDSVINIAKNDQVKAKTEIGTFTPITGSEILQAPLHLIQDYDYRVGSKESSSIQNYMFFDPTQKRSYWLRAKSEGLFLSAIALAPKVTPIVNNSILNTNTEEKSVPVVAFLYVLVDKDTNNDKRINDSDQKQIAISNAAGTSFKVLVDQVDRFNGYSTIKNNRLSVLYTSSNKLKVAEIDWRSQEIISNSEFSSQP
ncbi:hypothetical protein H6F42_11760 [Pseudanabaena sp. FACHB-1998]|uniref:hypothetical protein n=1 Tax=Pseudanabaena sp. FACHB-1998 TaxID=2692858 RepID=UPI001681BEFD|nr:hypothetical protein [Pseudanabaena sp. FACHB-1998]MBD2177589.1 hypothetical protein [Pseudanabaena sp. FACHB-1998]